MNPYMSDPGKGQQGNFNPYTALYDTNGNPIQYDTNGNPIKPNANFMNQNIGGVNGLNGNTITAAVGSGVSEYAQQQIRSADDFTVDQYAGLKGSGKGFMNGASAGPIGMIVGAVLGGVGAQMGQFKAINKNIDKVNKQQIDLVGEGADGSPMYQGGAYLSARSNMSALKKGLASTGKKNPLDLATAAFEMAYGTRSKLRRALKRQKRLVREGQSDFNDAALAADEQRQAMTSYQDQLNTQSRMFNLFNIQPNLGV